MSGGALALALGAAVLHATWNVLLAGARNTAAATGGLIVWGVALLAIPAVLVADVSTSAIPFILASAALELGYFLLLARAYDTGELSVVYPVARGVAPALVLVVGVMTGLGERVGVLGAVGVLCIVGGVLLVGAQGRTASRDLGFGLAIAAAIAAYTLVDSEGVQRAAPVTYLALVLAPSAVLYPAVVRTGPDLGVRSAFTAAATLGAYLLVLFALELAPPAPVAAVRESSVVIATLLAAAFLGERVSAVRVAGSVLVVAGVAAIAYT
ncbi:MAG TPA: DMT family transporter [Thermoleophilaceae bacterium]|nr:DMT family transporter [Thermoleophilaceae bacterium]